MDCTNCQGLGYVEGFVYRDASLFPITSQCPRCKNTEAYSRRIQQLLNNTAAAHSLDVVHYSTGSRAENATAPVSNVIPLFPRRKI